MKQVKISEQLFVNLIKYFFLNDTSREDAIKHELNNKLKKMELRENYKNKLQK